MKISELFRKKLDMLLGKIDPAEAKFLKKNIYKDIDPSEGLTIKQMKLLIPEIIAHKIRIVGIETIDKKTGEFDVYTWEKFEKYYLNCWVIEAIQSIENKNSNVRCYLYFDFDLKYHNEY